jgi:hypothetical protein
MAIFVVGWISVLLDGCMGVGEWGVVDWVRTYYFAFEVVHVWYGFVEL